jgi:hypothetical protein
VIGSIWRVIDSDSGGTTRGLEGRDRLRVRLAAGACLAVRTPPGILAQR